MPRKKKKKAKAIVRRGLSDLPVFVIGHIHSFLEREDGRALAVAVPKYGRNYDVRSTVDRDVAFKECQTRHDRLVQACRLGDVGLVEWLHKNWSEPYKPLFFESPQCDSNPNHHQEIESLSKFLAFRVISEEYGVDISHILPAFWSLPSGDATIYKHAYLSTIQFGILEDIFKFKPERSKQSFGALGRLDVVKWIYEEDIWTCARLFVVDDAARHGQLHIIEWLHAWYPKELERRGCGAMNEAAYGGQLNVVKWLHENRTEGCTTYAMDRAAKYGHLDVVKWLHENRTEGCTTNAMDWAAKYGRLDVVKWLHANRTEGCTTEALEGSSENGHTDVITWLLENRPETIPPRFDSPMHYAANYGFLGIVQILHENTKVRCTTSAMDAAAGNGHIQVVRWLHTHRTEGCTKTAMTAAARHGHLEVVEFLFRHREEGYHDDTPFRALFDGQVHVARFFYYNTPQTSHGEFRRIFCEKGHLNEHAEESLHESTRSVHSYARPCTYISAQNWSCPKVIQDRCQSRRERKGSIRQ